MFVVVTLKEWLGMVAVALIIFFLGAMWLRGKVIHAWRALQRIFGK